MILKAETSTDREPKAQENDVEGGLSESEWDTLYQWHFLYLSTVIYFTFLESTWAQSKAK